MKTVYWSADFHSQINNQLIIPRIGESLFTHIKKEKKILADQQSLTYLVCPAASPSLKNIYRVKNEVKINFNYEENNTFGVEVNDNKLGGLLKQGFIKSLIHNRSIKDKNLSLQYDIILYCEDSLEVEQIHPWWERSEFARNTISIFGKLDISKWIRPIQPTFVCLKNNVTIEEGDALYYLKFNTDEKIKFVEFHTCSEIRSLIQAQTSLKFLKPLQKMSYIYNLFFKNKMNRRFLTLIKKNII